MHDPELYNFLAPESHLTFAKCSFDDPKVDTAFQRIIDEHQFNTKVSILLPGASSIPQKLEKELIEDKEFYKVENLPLFEFCTPVFLQAFLNAGNVYAVTCDARLDLDNTAALTPDGWLILLIDQFTYAKLPLHGKLSAHILRKPKEKYVVKVNLKENFIPGKPFYNKVMNAFRDVSLKFSFFLTWLPNDPTVCPSSIAKYFSDKGYEISQEEVIRNKVDLAETKVPVPIDSECEGPHEALDVEPEDLHEWIGCASLEVNLDSKGDSWCDMITPTPNRTLSAVQIVNAMGFFVPIHVHSLIKELRSLLKGTNEKTLPWVSLTVYGHVDSPITWGHTENYFGTNGDNFYTLVITRTQIWIYKVSGPRKPQRLFAKCNNNK